MGRVITPYRAGVTTDGLKHNKYRSRCFGRGACSRRAGGCDIHAAFDSPTGLIYPAMDTGNLTLRTNATVHEIDVDRDIPGRPAASRSSTRKRARPTRPKPGWWSSPRPRSNPRGCMLLSKSRQHPNGIGNSSGHVGHNFCEHLMGPSVTGLVKDLVGKPRTLDDGRPGGFYVPRFRNLSEKRTDFIRGYGFEGEGGTTMFPDQPRPLPGFGADFKKTVRDYAGAFISMGGFGEVLRPLRELRRPRPGGEGQVGHPGPPLPLPVRRQRAEDGRRHGGDGARDVRERGLRDRQRRARTCLPRAGRFTSWAPRAWEPIRRHRWSTSSSSRTT